MEELEESRVFLTLETENELIGPTALNGPVAGDRGFAPLALVFHHRSWRRWLGFLDAGFDTLHDVARVSLQVGGDVHRKCLLNVQSIVQRKWPRRGTSSPRPHFSLEPVLNIQAARYLVQIKISPNVASCPRRSRLQDYLVGTTHRAPYKSSDANALSKYRLRLLLTFRARQIQQWRDLVRSVRCGLTGSGQATTGFQPQVNIIPLNFLKEVKRRVKLMMYIKARTNNFANILTWLLR